MKTFLITGGAGFIGSNLVEHLFRSHPDCRILVLDALTYAGSLANIPPDIVASPRFEFWHGNVGNAELVNALVGQSSVVFHLAAETHVPRSIYDNRIFFETDVLGTQVVANAALTHHKVVERLIHVSSSEAYGSAINGPMSEDHPLNPTTPYASAKAGADRLVYSYGVTYELKTVIVRPFNNYGPRQHIEKVVPRFITRALRGAPLTVHGTGSNTRDWVFVEDTCRALVAMIDAPLEPGSPAVVNVGTEREISVMDIARLVQDVMGTGSVDFIRDRPGQVSRHLADAARIRAWLGWKPRVSFEEGLARTIEWYRSNPAWWQAQLSMETVKTRTKWGDVEDH